MACKWCHNPESISKNREILYDYRKCLRCGNCVKICKNNAHLIADDKHYFLRDKCLLCMKCVDACPHNALEICGKEISYDEIQDIISRDKAFFDSSNGGITITGGEPMVQKNFTFTILKKIKDIGINTCLDTNGYWNFENIKEMLEYIDLIKYDIKLINLEKHVFYTGRSNKLILNNLRSLSALSKKIIITIPLIHEVNDSDEEIDSFISYINNLQNSPIVQLLPYHGMYKSKVEKIGLNYEEFLKPKNIKKIEQHFSENNIQLYKG